MTQIEDIYHEHVRRVLAFFTYRLGGCRQEAEDLTQATFERALRSIDRYDASKGSRLTWLMAIAQNLLVDHYRSDESGRTRATEPRELEGLAGGSDPIQHVFLGLAPELADALALLNPRDREIVSLCYGADLSGPVIAELKGMTVANVQQVLSRALRRMRTAIEAGMVTAEEELRTVRASPIQPALAVSASR